MSVIGTPRSSGSFGNVCAFCHFWDGDAQLTRYKISDVLYDDNARGSCLAISNNVEKATRPACSRFRISNQASKYCKR